MDQRERYVDEAETQRLAMESWQARMWTALPCVVQAFPSASGIGSMLLDAQPTIAATYLDATGKLQVLQMPLLINVPVVFPGGGGVSLTFPIQKGDECLVVFTSRCLDAWWQLGAAPAPNPGLVPPDARMHNLSDGVAFVGLRSNPRAYAPDPNYAQLRSDDGQTFIAVQPTTHEVKVQTSGQLNATAANGINLNGVTIDSNGNLTSPATIAAATEVKVGSHTLTQHQHADPQGSSVAKPTG